MNERGKTVLTAMRERRSVRWCSDDHVPKEDIDAIPAAETSAPTVFPAG